MSLGQIKRTGEQGRGLGLTGTILGYVGLAFVLLGMIVFFALLPAADREREQRRPDRSGIGPLPA